MPLSRRALTIPLPVRQLSARLALEPAPESWSPEYINAQVDAMATGKWGSELSDHASGATWVMVKLLRAHGWGSSLMPWE